MNQNTQDTMQAVAIDHFGGTETMKLRKLPVPEVGEDEVLIHVERAGVGVWDPFEREGGFAKEFNFQPAFPYVLGSDGAVTVEAVGERVRGLKKGDRAYGVSLKGGFYAQYAALKAESEFPVPEKLSIEEAGAMPVDAVTVL